MPSPSQPKSALTPSELAACVSKISGTSWAAHPSGGPIVLTYSTGVPEQWLLGLSAVAHGLPLVLVGLGRRGWSWWSPAGKLPGTARALQFMNALTPSAPIVFADGGDTVVANRWTQAEVERTSAMIGGGNLGSSSSSSSSAVDRVITGGECNSWPLCYNESYLRDHSYRRCLAGSAACYPNSGTYLGRPAALLGFVDGLKSTLRRMDARGYAGRLEAEKGNDQALLHRLYLHRARHAAATAQQPQSPAQPQPPAYSLHIDGEAAVFLSLFPCSGYHRYKRRGNGPFEYCHEKPFDPMRRLQSTGNGTGLVLRSMDVTGSRSSSRSSGSDGDSSHTSSRDRRPLLLHANGKHYRLHERPLAPLLSWLLSPSAAERARIERHPVLLIDSVPLGTCGVATFGSVMRGWQKRTVVP